MRNILMTATLALCSCMAMAQGHDWENQYVLSINREPARAAFTPYLTAPGDMTMTLDGQWKFNWTKTPDMQPENFYQTDFNDSGWTTFPVPGDWEMNGYGTPIYCSSGYVFKINPPYVMGEPKQKYTSFIERNPTGCYRRTFTVPASWSGKECMSTSAQCRAHSTFMSTASRWATRRAAWSRQSSGSRPTSTAALTS